MDAKHGNDWQSVLAMSLASTFRTDRLKSVKESLCVVGVYDDC
jgi:hypothetical protein